MPSLFGSGSSPFDQAVEAATSDRNQEDDWAQIMDLCDKIQALKDGPRDCLRAIYKRANHRNQTVSTKALTLLDACVSNCGRKFSSEISSRDSISELRKIANLSGRTAEKLRGFIKKWAEGGDLKSEGAIVQLNNELKSGSTVYSTVTFEPSERSRTSSHKSTSKMTDQELQEKEIEDLARAMALSMQESQGKQSNNVATTQSSNSAPLYPAMMAATVPANSSLGSTSMVSLNVNEPRKVRALYDFEAAEENELTFKTGDIIFVLDDSDANWWRGYTTATPSFAQSEGLLFPSNFVTSDLTYQPAPETTVKKEEQPAAAPAAVDQAQVVIDEAKIDRGLSLIQEADPTGEQRPDSDELLRIEQECRFMVPMVDTELEKVDGLHAKLTDVNQALVDVFAEYHRQMSQEVSDKRQQLMSTMQYGMQQGMQPQYYDPSSASTFIPSYGIPLAGAPGAVTYGGPPAANMVAPQQQQQLPQQQQQQQQQPFATQQQPPMPVTNGFTSPGQMGGAYQQQQAAPPQMQHNQPMPAYGGPGAFQPGAMQAQQAPVMQQPPASVGSQPHFAQMQQGQV